MKCAHCQQEFSPRDECQIYCRKACSQRASAKRKKLRERGELPAEQEAIVQVNQFIERLFSHIRRGAYACTQINRALFPGVHLDIQSKETLEQEYRREHPLTISKEAA